MEVSVGSIGGPESEVFGYRVFVEEEFFLLLATFLHGEGGPNDSIIGVLSIVRVEPIVVPIKYQSHDVEFNGLCELDVQPFCVDGGGIVSFITCDSKGVPGGSS
eukprot:CAMPEP_0170541664 /NCGR_PEP_ID=MMETSP0211-20121228/1339_1 /TAXON_ID=311385 /ORGANISM="Pseudokeronopsis sp., Strain OXSARD2" /LENGTH=103 /DNA_ID=CAMNT_0010844487 /DNA_START=77 /DNA_END=388 /DNA_ORIENTATION=+